MTRRLRLEVVYRETAKGGGIFIATRVVARICIDTAIDSIYRVEIGILETVHGDEFRVCRGWIGGSKGEATP